MRQFKNGDTLFKVLARNGSYALLKQLGEYPEYVIAVNIHGEKEGYWDQGRYFGDNLDAAKEVYEDYISGNTTAYIDWLRKPE